MALNTVEGFDQYGLDETKLLEGNYAEVVGWVLTQDVDQVRTGTTALLAANTLFEDTLRRVFPEQNTYSIVGFAFRNEDKLPEEPNRQILITFRDANNDIQVGLDVMTTGQLRVTFGGTEIHSLLPLVKVEAFHSVEIKVDIDDTTGDVIVIFDGNTVVWDGANTSINTDTTEFGSMSQYVFGTWFPHGGTLNPLWSLDDIYVLDANGTINDDFIGDKQAFLVLPDADTATAEWDITGAATGWEAISEIPSDGDTSYIEADGAPEESIFGLEDIATDIVNIVGVQMSHVVRKLDSGPSTYQGTIISNAVEANGADRTIPESYTTFNDIVENNPDGDVVWTPTTWNAAQYKTERTS